MARKLSLALVIIVATVSAGIAAAEPVDEGFLPTWQRTDQPVAAGQVSRTWMWGPEAFTPVLAEEYAESPGGERQVQYFDKSRMEITNPAADPGSVWYVTNGLLTTELITGRMQVGHDSFVEREPAEVNVAGDPDDPNGPTYASFTGLLDAPPIPSGWLVTQRLSRDGTTRLDPGLTGMNVSVGLPDAQTGHTIADPFWEFMSSTGPVYEGGDYTTAPLFENPYYATGRPITEPYWAEVLVGGTPRDVLVQCFERRCLTYTPDNPEGWQVEAGNVGRHYHQWRYEQQGLDVPRGVYQTSITGTASSAGQIDGDVRRGVSFNGDAEGDINGRFQASIDYSPPDPGPGATHQIVSGTWSITSDDGGITGVIAGGTATWDDQGANVRLDIRMSVRGSTGIYSTVPRLARFTGTLDQTPGIPRITGTLALYR